MTYVNFLSFLDFERFHFKVRKSCFIRSREYIALSFGLVIFLNQVWNEEINVSKFLRDSIKSFIRASDVISFFLFPFSKTMSRRDIQVHWIFLIHSQWKFSHCRCYAISLGLQQHTYYAMEEHNTSKDIYF